MRIGAAQNQVGGTGAGAGNIITGSGWIGIVLDADAGSGNLILSNAIFDNAATGIDLGRDTPTPNDEGDVDTGPNNLQNYPVLTSVASNDGAAIRATLNSLPSSSYTVEFFSNHACDDTGFGEGETPMGTATLTTDASGSGSVTAAFESISGSVMTATATDAQGNTSEFSACAELTTLGVSSSPSTQIVSQGITVTAQGGTFEGTVDLACSGAPAYSTCGLEDDQLTLTGGQASTTMTVSTSAPAGGFPAAPDEAPGDRGLWLWGLLLAPGLLALGVRGTDRLVRTSGIRPISGSVHGRLPWVGVLVLGCLALALQISCGGDGSSPPTGGTPSGSHDLTVSAAWESAESTATVTLVVQ
jgi:hypothetical protein